MLHVEVVLVVEDGYDVAILLRGGGGVGLVAVGRDGDGGEVDLLSHLEMCCQLRMSGLMRMRGC